MDPELGKFKAGSRSGINHSGSATLILLKPRITSVAVQDKQNSLMISAGKERKNSVQK